MSNSVENSDTVNFIVGGVYYSLLLSDIKAHKDCYFASAIKDEWNNSDKPIVIDRDGALFQHIFVYMYNSRYQFPFVVNGSLSLLVSVRREADYYNLPELVAACDKTYEKELIKWCTNQPLSNLFGSYTLDAPDTSVSGLNSFVASEVFPGCYTGTVDPAKMRAMDVNKVLSRHKYDIFDEKYKNCFNLWLDDDYCFMHSLQNALPTLPLTGVSCSLNEGNVFAITEDGFAYSAPLGAFSLTHIGTIVYILPFDYTGGVITVSGNGISRSISKAGEYIIYTNDYSCTISTVTSGMLVYAKFSVAGDMFVGYRTIVPNAPAPNKDALVQAVASELIDCSVGVVLCLSTLYSIVAFDSSGPYLETDPGVLSERDALLYEYLRGGFEITLVTVYVQRSENENEGCVLGPVPVQSDKIKIIAPFYGFRVPFEVVRNIDGTNVASAKSSGGEAFATLYSAMYINAK